jgi:hypothetical protein
LLTGIALASNGGGSTPSANSGPAPVAIADPAPSSAAPDPAPDPAPDAAPDPAADAAPDPAADPGPSSQCVLQQSAQANCTSSDPEVALEDTNYSDTSGCTFSAQVTWGDGSQQTVQYQGNDGAEDFVASHTYQQQGTYTISFAPTVLSGGCSDSNMAYTFTYSPG